MLNSPVFIGLVGRLLGGSQHSLMRFLVRAGACGMLAFTRATGFAINNQGAMHRPSFAFNHRLTGRFKGRLRQLIAAATPYGRP